MVLVGVLLECRLRGGGRIYDGADGLVLRGVGVREVCDGVGLIGGERPEHGACVPCGLQLFDEGVGDGVSGVSVSTGVGERPDATQRCSGDGDALLQVGAQLAVREGAIVRVESRNSDELMAGKGYDLAALVHEQSISTNTAAAGGNAQLMTMA